MMDHTTTAPTGLQQFLEDMGLVTEKVAARFPTREEALSKDFYNRYNLDENGEPKW